MNDEAFDLLVVGAGPAGHAAAVEAGRLGRRVLLVDRAAAPGGFCVRTGTVPSKTLRETALALDRFRRTTGGVIAVSLPEDVQVASLMQRLERVKRDYERVLSAQLDAVGVQTARAAARVTAPGEVELVHVGGRKDRVRARAIVIATGSTPRTPPDVPVDHQHVFDSDSILSLEYLPRSLIVLGGGVIASEYAGIFAALGVVVTMLDRAPRPLGFLDEEITTWFERGLATRGARYLGGRKATKIAFDGLATVDVDLDDGSRISADKVFCALGRTAVTAGLGLAEIGVEITARGFVAVDAQGRTRVPGVFAAGDVIGPPALAATSALQGRLVARAALGLSTPSFTGLPIGVYAIPELASVGLSESEALGQHGRVLVGRAHFRDLARGHISGDPEGMLKLVLHPDTLAVLGAQAVGEDATSLVHLAELALVGGLDVHVFLDHAYNFPTLAEAYRLAALDALGARARLGDVPTRAAAE